jgi:hypothetical protein
MRACTVSASEENVREAELKAIDRLPASGGEIMLRSR